MASPALTPKEEDVMKEYASSLEDLTLNSKPLINMLTMLADENRANARAIVLAIEHHLRKVPSEVKLPVLYLIDSIIKNVGSPYSTLFNQNIVPLFCSVFEKGDEKMRVQLFKLRNTWNQMLPAPKLYALDVHVNNFDPAWPVQQLPTMIHVNPKFLPPQHNQSGTTTTTAVPSTTITTTTTTAAGTAVAVVAPLAAETAVEVSKPGAAVVADESAAAIALSEAVLRENLRKKQKKLLELKQRKLELELLQTRKKLKEQELQSSALRKADKQKRSQPPTCSSSSSSSSLSIAADFEKRASSRSQLSRKLKQELVAAQARLPAAPAAVVTTTPPTTTTNITTTTTTSAPATKLTASEAPAAQLAQSSMSSSMAAKSQTMAGSGTGGGAVVRIAPVSSQLLSAVQKRATRDPRLLRGTQAAAPAPAPAPTTTSQSQKPTSISSKVSKSASHSKTELTSRASRSPAAANSVDSTANSVDSTANSVDSTANSVDSTASAAAAGVVSVTRTTAVKSQEPISVSVPYPGPTCTTTTTASTCATSLTAATSHSSADAHAHKSHRSSHHRRRESRRGGSSSPSSSSSQHASPKIIDSITEKDVLDLDKDKEKKDVSRTKDLQPEATEPQVDSTTSKDVDQRKATPTHTTQSAASSSSSSSVLPPPPTQPVTSNSCKRLSEERDLPADVPPQKKTKVMERFDELFGETDKDMRSDFGSGGSQQSQSEQEEQQRPPTPPPPVIRPLAEVDENRGRWSKYKVDKPDVYRSSASATAAASRQASEPYARRNKQTDRLGRPLLYNRHQHDKEHSSRQRHRRDRVGVDQQDDNSRSSSLTAACSANTSANYTVILKQAEEQLNQGNLSSSSYNQIIKEVIAMNEQKKLEEARRKEERDRMRMRRKNKAQSGGGHSKRHQHQHPEQEQPFNQSRHFAQIDNLDPISDDDFSGQNSSTCQGSVPNSEISSTADGQNEDEILSDSESNSSVGSSYAVSEDCEEFSESQKDGKINGDNADISDMELSPEDEISEPVVEKDVSQVEAESEDVSSQSTNVEHDTKDAYEPLQPPPMPPVFLPSTSVSDDATEEASENENKDVVVKEDVKSEVADSTVNEESGVNVSGGEQVLKVDVDNRLGFPSMMPGGMMGMKPSPPLMDNAFMPTPASLPVMMSSKDIDMRIGLRPPPMAVMQQPPVPPLALNPGLEPSGGVPMDQDMVPDNVVDAKPPQPTRGSAESSRDEESNNDNNGGDFVDKGPPPHPWAQPELAPGSPWIANLMQGAAPQGPPAPVQCWPPGVGLQPPPRPHMIPLRPPPIPPQVMFEPPNSNSRLRPMPMRIHAQGMIAGGGPGGPRGPGGPGGPVALPPADPSVLDMIAEDTMKSIEIDGTQRDIRFYGEMAVIFLSWDDPREIHFQSSSPRKLIIDDRHTIALNFNAPYQDVIIDGVPHAVRLGGPTRELYVDGTFHQVLFGGPPVTVSVGGQLRRVQLEGPPPQVRIGRPRLDLCLGKITLIVDALHHYTIFLDPKAQRFELDNVPHIIRFVEALETTVINGVPFKFEFGGLPRPVFSRGKKYYVRLTSLPNGVIPGYVDILGMEGGRRGDPPPPAPLAPRKQPISAAAVIDQNSQSSEHAPFSPSGSPTRPEFLNDDRSMPMMDSDATMMEAPPLKSSASTEPFRKHPSPVKANPLDVLSTLLAPAATAPVSGFSYSVEKEHSYQPSTTNTSPDQAVEKPKTSLLLGEINIQELFQKLVATGIVPTAASAAAGKAAAPSTTSPSAKDKDEQQDSADEDVSSAIEFVDFGKPQTLRKRQPGLIKALYAGIQCSSCGVRFAPEQTIKYSQHLDWHFRQNRRERDSARTVQSRTWYYDVSDWTQYEEIEDIEQRALSWFDTQAMAGMAGGGAGGGPGEEGGEDDADVPSVPCESGSVEVRCALCRDKFDIFYNEDKEEWHLRRAVNVDDAIYHPLCHEDYLASMKTPPPEPEPEQPNPEPIASITIDEDDSEEGVKKKEEGDKMEEGEDDVKAVEEDDDDDVIIQESEHKMEIIELLKDDDEEEEEERQRSKDAIENLDEESGSKMSIDKKTDKDSELEDEKSQLTNDSSNNQPSITDFKSILKNIKMEPVDDENDPDIEEVTSIIDLEHVNIKREEEEEAAALAKPVCVDTTQVKVACSIDGNVELDDSAAAVVAAPSKIKINISKPVVVSAPAPPPAAVPTSVEVKSTSSVSSSSTSMTSFSGVKPLTAGAVVPLALVESSQPPPPGEEPGPLNLKPKLIGRKLTELPSVSRGTELSGLCSIM